MSDAVGNNERPLPRGIWKPTLDEVSEFAYQCWVEFKQNNSI